MTAPDRIDVRAQVVTAQVGPAQLDLTRLSDQEFHALQAVYGKLALAAPVDPVDPE